MKIEFLELRVVKNHTYHNGDIADLEQYAAESLIERGFAKSLEVKDEIIIEPETKIEKKDKQKRKGK